MDVSVIIVSYNTKDLTLNCIRSIYEHTNGIDFEIIVVDNASSDESVNTIKEFFTEITVIESEINLGFGSANNLGSQFAKGKYLFFLNSDCILIENSIKKMFDYFESHNNSFNRIGAVGCMLLDGNLRLNTSYHRFPTPSSQLRWSFIGIINKLCRTKLMPKQISNYHLDRSGKVDFITGADLFIPKEIFFLLKGFDTNFFMYYEETDLQKRMSKMLLKRVVLKDTSIIHLGGASTIKRLSSTTFFVDSDFKYMRKHYSSVVYFLYYILKIVLLIPTLFNDSHSKIDRKNYLKMLISNCKIIS